MKQMEGDKGAKCHVSFFFLKKKKEEKKAFPHGASIIA